MDPLYHTAQIEKKNRIISAALVLLLIANVFVWHIFFTSGHKFLTVAVLDIGQGDSIFIEAPNGRQVIFDGGPNGKILSELSGVMPFYDRSIDMIVVTNPDQDHFAGFIDLLERYKVAQVIEPGTVSKSAIYQEFEKSVRDEGAKKLLAKRGMRIMLDPEHLVYIDILFPDKPLEEVQKLSSNDGSIVARLVYGDTSFMLTGDTTAKTEHYLVGLDGDTLKSTVLKVAHHGSKTSSSEEFVKEVLPEYAAISDGRENKYGHPNRETLDTLEKFKIKILRTDLQGRIVFESDGKKVEIK